MRIFNTKVMVDDDAVMNALYEKFPDEVRDAVIARGYVQSPFEVRRVFFAVCLHQCLLLDINLCVVMPSVMPHTVNGGGVHQKESCAQCGQGTWIFQKSLCRAAGRLFIYDHGPY